MYSKLKKNLLLMPIDCEKKDFTEVEKNLLIGNIEFAQNHYSMKKNGISLVIAVYPKDLINLSLQLIPNNCRFHHIDAKDYVFEDLISHFDKCYDMINEELVENEGSVLVFCGAGFSRSVTIVSAYLMKKYRISAEDAVQRIRSSRPRINPNQGFLAQLLLFEQMDYQLDRTNHEYRAFVLICLKKQIWTQKYWEDSVSGRLERQFCTPMQSYHYKLSINRPEPKFNYHCIQCNEELFDEMNVLSNCEIKDSTLCAKLFIEPIKWMTSLLCSNKKGDIECPKCGKYLGAFKWKSFKCNCPLHEGLNDARIVKMNKFSVVRRAVD